MTVPQTATAAGTAARPAYLAFDLGAESGRAILAILDGPKLELEVVHRFPNVPQRLPSGLHWNLLGLHAHLIQGLALSQELARDRGARIVSVGVDTWGVDFALIGASGLVLATPFAYRDERNAPAMQSAFETLGQERLYERTGIQFMALNSLYQLVATQMAEPALLMMTQRLLHTPDVLHYFLSGRMINEATIASTGQTIDPRSGEWAIDLFEGLALPHHYLHPTVPAATVVGPLRDEVVKEAGLPEDHGIQVIAPGSHDTASAVAAVPVDVAATPNWAYLSSGTWSLMGMELDEPIISDESFQAGFTNERGVEDKIRFLKNISGLWLVQEIRRDFAVRGEPYEYDQLVELAAEAEPFVTLVDPNHSPFMTPDDMPAKFDAFAELTGQPKPSGIGGYVRCALESLALFYRKTLEGLEAVTQRKIEVLHVVGGGGQNGLLNRMTADALGIPVIVGPFEATAVGNALTQAIGHGTVKDLDDLRRIVRESFSPERFEPRNAQAFDAQRQRFESLLGK
jgi:rhamnulokinase